MDAEISFVNPSEVLRSLICVCLLLSLDPPNPALEIPQVEIFQFHTGEGTAILLPQLTSLFVYKFFPFRFYDAVVGAFNGSPWLRVASWPCVPFAKLTNGLGPECLQLFTKKKKKILSFSKKQQLSENGWKVLFCFLLCPRGEQPLACTVECAAFGLMPSFLRSVCP